MRIRLPQKDLYTLRRPSLSDRPDPKAVKAARRYIADFWPQLTHYEPKNVDALVGLPKPYIVPSHDPKCRFNYDELYYWDSFFIAQGLLDKEHEALVCGMLEDLIYLFKRFGIIPNASRYYLTGRSQPPLLTSYIFSVYEAFNPGLPWLKRTMAVAQAEYETVWMGVQKPNDRLVYRGLSRYYDINMLHDLAEAESGWDMTPRFHRRALNYVPVDLNALLFKYETDFARAATLFGDEATSKIWRIKAATRAAVMSELMWNPHQGLFYDYDYVLGRRGKVNSLAAYYPLWAGMASTDQAAALVRSLRLFERPGGLATTDRIRSAEILPMQWAYPNGWAPLHFLVVQGLERYGYHTEARRIALKWLCTNLDWFTAHNEFLEKYNVVRPAELPQPGVYPTQKGFGWTNAIFERFCRDYIDTPRPAAR